LSSDSDDENDGPKGYGHPPKQHQWKKGRSGNPKGRPKKEKKPNRRNIEAIILKELDDEVLLVNGIEMTRLQIETIALRNKAAKGDISAMRLLDQKRKTMGLDKPLHRSGVLVVPMAPPLDEWERLTAKEQARYRENRVEQIRRFQNYEDDDD